MNNVVLMGRLTRDAEVRYGNDNLAIARFTLAVDRRVARTGAEGQTTADFIGCVAFGKTAEFLEKYGKKGVKFALVGRIQTGSYTNKDGQKVYTTDVVAESVEFAESRNASGNAGGFGGGAADGFNAGADAGNDFMNIPDSIVEELPF